MGAAFFGGSLDLNDFRWWALFRSKEVRCQLITGEIQISLHVRKMFKSTLSIPEYLLLLGFVGLSLQLQLMRFRLLLHLLPLTQALLLTCNLHVLQRLLLVLVLAIESKFRPTLDGVVVHLL